MAAQALWQPGVIQYLSYPHGPIPPGHHGPLKARVTWRPSGPNTPQPRQVPLQQDAKFYLFSELPLEIRLKIWNFASPPRVIEIRSWGNNIANRFRPVKFSTPPQKPPIIFRINHESREEAVRLYTVVEIGISVSILDPSRQYVDWKLHSMNSYRRRMHFFHHDVSNLPLATPYPAQKTYINFCRDTIYLGPEFQSYHLESLLTATGPKMELSGLQYLAMDKKLWTASVDARWHMGHLRAALYSLRSRPIKEIYIVTDDLKEALPDKFYYREHEITLHDAPYEYEFDLSDKGEKEKTVVQNLEGWFERLWKDKDTEKESPKVEVKSVRRDGRSLSSFKDGIWEVQKVMGGMESWKSWTPADEAHTL